MPCPFHSADDAEPDSTEQTVDEARDDRGVERREFMKSALLIGGTSALGTATSLFGVPEAAAADAPVSVAARNNRQHAWDRWETHLPDHQQTVPPAYHLVLLADYEGDGAPTPAHRREVAAAFEQLESAFAWGHEGLLFTVGYSLGYFRRYDEPLPPGLDPEVDPTNKPGLLGARTLIDAAGVTLPREDPVADTHDVCLHLASDHVQTLLAAEAALWGERESAHGVTFEATLDGILTKPASYPDRRVGFAGHDALEAEGGEEEPDGVYPDDIPEAADLSMGFNDQYRNSVPRETDATMLEDQQLVEPKPPGVFAQGTIQHLSKLDINLSEDAGEREGGWYDDHSAAERRQQMFSPDHTAENTGEVGEALGNSTAAGETAMRNLDADEPDLAERTAQHAAEHDRVGHAQKTARARFDLQERITPAGRERLSGGEEPLPADERENTVGTAGEPYDEPLPGHDGTQTTEQVILRRDVDTVDGNRPGNHFIALMRFAPYMAYMRRAMNGVEFETGQFGLDPDADGLDHSGDVPDENDGIVHYVTTQRRGNFLVPPLTLRALPHPRGEPVSISVTRRGDSYVVESDDLHRRAVDPETVRFGWFYDVNRGRGARPSRVSNRGGTFTAVFPASETGIDAAPGGPNGDDDVRLRLFAKRSDSRRPVRGTASLRTVTTGERGAGRGDERRDDGDGEDGERDEAERGTGDDEGRGDGGRDGERGAGRGRGDGNAGRGNGRGA
ncbi:DUF7405 family protein [Natronomonas sp. EA1]|uniref:DUF7405 family protein n=1 Tax=Natronomonas sp. EA1 TaxID=3421655 RepID=UPI003EB948B6